MTSSLAPSPTNRVFASSAWLRALERVATIPRNPERMLATIIDAQAGITPDAPALLSYDENLSYASLAARKNQYARWALEQGIQKDEVVGLLMLNCPEYLAVWTGISSVGGVVALINTNLSGHSLAHCINAVVPKHIIASPELSESINAVLPLLSRYPYVWVCGEGREAFQSITRHVESLPADALSSQERRSVTIADRALCIYTSGTTGLPKAANVSHARILQWSLWFSGMIDVRENDRTYNCLPMYHSIGGVLAPGAALAGGASVFIRDKFSASNFWSDIKNHNCTLFQYIGELCRYLLLATSPDEALGHRLRMACGNGMASEVWRQFVSCFQIPRILEFYASTEGGLSLFNAEGHVGAIGRIPSYLTHRFSPALIRINMETGDPLRDENGFCIRCDVDEVGEAIGQRANNPTAIGTAYEGYTDSAASEQKVLRNAFTRGDAWICTGDLMRKDAYGFYYFVDRIGDTFRWKGENVATSEVAEALCSYPGVRHASVYGVTLPGSEGRAGMAALDVDPTLNLRDLHKHLVSRLPGYARPMFIRVTETMEMTGTHKYAKSDLVRQGYNPSASRDRLYFNDFEANTFVYLDEALYDRIQSGCIQL